MRLLSTANVLACRPEDEPRSEPACAFARLLRRGRLDLVEPDAGRSRSAAALRVARMHGDFSSDAASELVRMRTFTPRCASAASSAVPSSPGHEVRRDEVERLLRPAHRSHQLREEQHVGALGRCRASWPGRRTRPRAVVHSSASLPVEQLAHQRRRAHRLEIGDRFRVGARRREPGLEIGGAVRRRRRRRSSTPGRRTRCSSRDRTPATPRAPPRRRRARRGRRTRRRCPAPKYSLPMLRPPTIVTWLSAVNDLLCMRRFTRVKSVTKLSARVVAMDERVVEAHLDVRMRVERGDAWDRARCVFVVVEQQPHAHAALGRLPQRLEQQVADLVAVPDVVLHVERLFRGAGEQRRARRRRRGDRAADGCRSCPGFAATPGATARPSRVPAVSVRAVVSVRPSGGGRLAQPASSAASAATADASILDTSSGFVPQIGLPILASPRGAGSRHGRSAVRSARATPPVVGPSVRTGRIGRRCRKMSNAGRENDWRNRSRTTNAER